MRLSRNQFHASFASGLVGRARRRAATLAFFLVAALALLAAPFFPARAETAGAQRYLVIFAGQQLSDGGFALGGDHALYHQVALDLVAAAGGTVVADLSRQTGIIIADSAEESFASTLLSSPLVEEVGQDFSWKAMPSYDEALASGQLNVVENPLEPEQWNMSLINAPAARAQQPGSPQVDVGIIDSGIDYTHADLRENIDLERSRDFVTVGDDEWRGVGIPGAASDNMFHGTHVAGIVAARANGVGVVGVAPNVKLVSIKSCDTSGHCYVAPVVEGITYAGDIQLDVINMSLFVDDNAPLESTELKCMTDANQKVFRKAVERAISYARSRGVAPVAALGNSNTDLNADNTCDVVPAEVTGVIGVAALGPQSEKSSYSSYGFGETDVAAPGGNFSRSQHGLENFCARQVLSTIPGGYGCFQGTSMASPHAAGVAALIVSQFGTLGADGDVKLAPAQVESLLQQTASDIGASGYDQYFGNGRVDALRAVSGGK